MWNNQILQKIVALDLQTNRMKERQISALAEYAIISENLIYPYQKLLQKLWLVTKLCEDLNS